VHTGEENIKKSRMSLFDSIKEVGEKFVKEWIKIRQFIKRESICLHFK
jgi:hypothetical protein